MSARKRWPPILLALIMLMIAALACNVTSGGDDDRDPTRTSGTAVGEADVPTITIQAPEDGAQVLVDTDVLIFATAEDAIGVTRVELLVNNFVVASQSSPNLETGEQEFEVLLKWQPRSAGTQRLEVIPWRDDVRGEPAVINLVVRASRSEITQTAAGPTLPFLTPTQFQDQTCRVQVAVGALSVRNGPGLIYDVIDQVTIGQSLEVTGRQLYPDPWWQVYYNGRYGWVSGYYVNQLGNCTAIGVVLPPPTPTLAPNANPPTIPPTNTPLPPTPTPIIITATPLPPGTSTLPPTPEPCRIRVNQDGVSVFSGPGGGYIQIALLSAGQQLSVVARDSSGAWWQIAFMGTYGWIQTERTTLMGDCGSVPTVQSPPTPTATRTQAPRPTAVPNRDPRIEPIPDQQFQVGDGSALSINYSDPDGDSLSVVAESNAIDIVTANVQGSVLTIQANAPGTATITVRVTDGRGGAAQTRFRVTVGSPNREPRIGSIPDQNINVGEGTLFSIDVSDPDRDALTLSVKSSDSSVASVSVDNGALTLQANRPGTATITVTAEDEQGATAETQFTVTVASPNEGPRIEAISNQRLNVGEGTLFAINATDPDNDALTASAQSSDRNVVAVNVDGNNLTLQANGPGTATITVRVQDAEGSTAQTQFTVTVANPNREPRIQAISDQTFNVGDGTLLSLNASDPDNDSLTASAESSDPNVVAANVDGNNLTLQANGPGTATITVRVEDENGATAQTQFTVTVASPNREPRIEAIPDQRLNVGEGTLFAINATDPDNDSLSASAESSDPNVVAANVDGNNLTLQANGPGTATITVRVQDQAGATVQTQFTVTVASPNREPRIEAVPDQTFNVGEGTLLSLNATDPDNDTLSTSAESSDPNVVAANVDGNNLTLQANGPGTATITVRVQDQAGATAQTQFTVTVASPNREPRIEAIPDQTLNVGEGTLFAINATDPDGDQLSFVAESSDANVVVANADPTGALTLQANGPGTATVTIRVQDAQGNTAQSQFNVTVQQPEQPEQPPQGGGVGEVEILSPLQGDVLRTVRQTYRRGQQNMLPPPNPGVFSVAGDTPPAQFLSDLADGSANFTDLPDQEQLDDVVFYYASTPLWTGGNSFQAGGSLSTNPNWTAAALLDPANGDPANCGGTLSPLECELMVSRPAVIFINVGRNDVLNGTPPNQFRRSLRTIVETSIAQGAIPVLMTIPGLTPEQMAYNIVIVEVAGEYTVPLINVWRQIAENAPGGVNPDLTLTSPGVNDQFTPGDLANFGVPNRNLLVLRMLAQLRVDVPIP